MKKILLAGATGYLGSYILKELMNQWFMVRALFRNRSKPEMSAADEFEIMEGEITRPGTIINCCEQVDVVISTVGITRQREGLTYLDVDYQVNLNLLKEAQHSGVKKFIYVSVLHGQYLRELKICEAKKKFKYDRSRIRATHAEGIFQRDCRTEKPAKITLRTGIFFSIYKNT